MMLRNPFLIIRCRTTDNDRLLSFPDISITWFRLLWQYSLDPPTTSTRVAEQKGEAYVEYTK